MELEESLKTLEDGTRDKPINIARPLIKAQSLKIYSVDPEDDKVDPRSPNKTSRILLSDLDPDLQVQLKKLDLQGDGYIDVFDIISLNEKEKEEKSRV